MAKKNSEKKIQGAAAQKIASVSKAVKTKSAFSIKWQLALALAIVSFVLYANTLKNGFVLDDSNIITENTIVTKGVSAIPEILTTPYRRGYWKAGNDLYRPLSLVTFAIEYQLWEKNPAPYHFINVLIFAGCVVLLFFFLDKLFDQKKTAAAFIAALLFALHPIHTEVVANIKSRDELLSFFFAFLCLNVFMKYVQTGKISQLLSGAFCFLLAFLSKETVITFIAVIPFIFFFFKNENRKYSTYITLSIIVVAIICLAARFEILSFYGANRTTDIYFIDNPLASPQLPLYSRLATAVLILGLYLKLLFIPYPLCCDYSYNSIPITSFSDPLVLVSLAAYISLSVIAVKRFLKNHKDPYAFTILFFLATLSLFSNIPFLIGATMGERFLFFPSVGFCLAIGLLMQQWVGKTEGISILKNPKIWAIIIPVSLSYAFIAFNRNNDWYDDYTLFSTDLKKNPDNCHLSFLLGTHFLNKETKINADPVQINSAEQKQNCDQAINYLSKSLAIYPEYEDAEKYLAAAYTDEKQYPMAISILKKLIKSNPKRGQFELGRAYYDNSQYDSAEGPLLRAVQQDGQNSLAINDLAGIYFFRKQYPEAIKFYLDAFALKPDFVKPCANVAVCYLYIKKYDSAIYYAKKAIAISPEYNSSYEILAAIFNGMGNSDSARKYEVIAQKNDKNFKL